MTIKQMVPLAGMGLVVWGLIALDWSKVLAGAVVYSVCALYYLAKTSRIRKDDALWLLYCTASEAYREMGPYLDRSPSWEQWAAAIHLGAMEKCVEENGIPRERIREVVCGTLDQIFSASDAQKIVDYYLCGDHTSAFHCAVHRAKRFLQHDIHMHSFPEEVASTELAIPGLSE